MWVQTRLLRSPDLRWGSSMVHSLLFALVKMPSISPGQASHYAPGFGLSPHSLCVLRSQPPGTQVQPESPRASLGKRGATCTSSSLLKFLIQWVLWSGCGRALREELLQRTLRPLAVVLRGKAWWGIAGALDSKRGTLVSCPFSRIVHVSPMNLRAFLSVPYQDAQPHPRLKSNGVRKW